MSNFKSASSDNVNVATVTREVLGLVMKMTGADKLRMLKKLNPDTRASISQDPNSASLTTELIGAVMKASLDKRCALLGELKAYDGSSKRRHSRQEYFVPIQYIIKGRLFNGYINNISKSGLFIETSKGSQPEVVKGEEILLNFDHPDTKRPMKLTGKIVRIMKSGLGILFDNLLY